MGEIIKKSSETTSIRVAGSPDEQHVTTVQSTFTKPQARLLHDPAVTFEEYHYYARRTREEEKNLEAPKLRWREIINGKTGKDAQQIDGGAEGKVPEVNFANEENRLQITDQEWTNASRAMRTASWVRTSLARCFFVPPYREPQNNCLGAPVLPLRGKY